MAETTISKLIVNSPYEVPSQHWRYDRDSRLFSLDQGRRPAGFVTATPGSRAFDDPGVFRELETVGRIRSRVDAWRDAGYTGVTGITKRLLEHWRDSEQRADRRFFFCQLEAIETLIWITEAPDAERVGLDIPGDGGDFRRYCTKMATGSGKTIVMAMLITWQVLNKVAYPQDGRFSRHIFVVAPGLTVKSRLQVLIPSAPGNYYDEFNVVPGGMEDKLRQGTVIVRNRHVLAPLDPKAGPRIVKKGKESDEAFSRRVLDELVTASNLLVINDEAHHAWRLPESSLRGVNKEEIQQATEWIGGLDRIHASRGILTCFDFTATPFIPSGSASAEDSLFAWVVSDFSLNDAIESGLVKTPRIVVRGDGQVTTQIRSRLYHIYADPDVKDDLARPAREQEPLPDLVTNGYYLLGLDWQETMKAWRAAGAPTPPVMITVANRTETAARVYHAFVSGKIAIAELQSQQRTLHIDSKVLAKAESRDEVAVEAPAPVDVDTDASDDDSATEATASHTDVAEDLRLKVDTVGRVGKLGEQVQNVISVGMLSEGWDAKTVTHIMGLRAFTSQLLCEQVIGRGLRRTAYEIDAVTGMFEPEYVNVFGVPFTFLPHEGGDGPPKPPAVPKLCIEPDPRKVQYEVTWPNVLRVDHQYRGQLTLDPDKLEPLTLHASDVTMLAEMAPVIAGKPDVSHINDIDLLKLGREFRMQKIIFSAASAAYEQMQPDWQGNREQLLAQLVRLAEQVVTSPKIRVQPDLYDHDPLRRRIVLTMNMTRLVNHLWQAIRFENTEALAPVFDTERPVRSTTDMRAWYTSKPCEVVKHSHINRCVYDSSWEATEAYEINRSPDVAAWAKNDHLGFEVLYTYKGAIHKYIPDFLIRLTNGATLVLEVKGQDDEEQLTKRRFLDEWVRAVNTHGGFGHWSWDISRKLLDVVDILHKHTAGPTA